VKLGFAGPPEVPIHRDELLRSPTPDPPSHEPDLKSEFLCRFSR
jgi:hypothetical protein